MRVMRPFTISYVETPHVTAAGTAPSKHRTIEIFLHEDRPLKFDDFRKKQRSSQSVSLLKIWRQSTLSPYSAQRLNDALHYPRFSILYIRRPAATPQRCLAAWEAAAAATGPPAAATATALGGIILPPMAQKRENDITSDTV